MWILSRLCIIIYTILNYFWIPVISGDDVLLPIISKQKAVYINTYDKWTRGFTLSLTTQQRLNKLLYNLNYNSEYVKFGEVWVSVNSSNHER